MGKGYLLHMLAKHLKAGDFMVGFGIIEDTAGGDTILRIFGPNGAAKDLDPYDRVTVRRG